MTQPVETVLKTDTVGRVMTPPVRREALLDEFEHSGLSGAEFAKLAGIKYQTFAAWAARRRKQRVPTPTSVSTPGASPVRWLEAVVGESPSSAVVSHGSLKLHLPRGVWIEIADLKQVPLAAALLQALQPRQPPC